MGLEDVWSCRLRIDFLDGKRLGMCLCPCHSIRAWLSRIADTEVEFRRTGHGLACSFGRYRSGYFDATKLTCLACFAWERHILVLFFAES